MTFRGVAGIVPPIGLLVLMGFVPRPTTAEPPATKATVPVSPPLPLTASERTRLEAEAAGQSAEADRRFKEMDFAGALPLYRAERATRVRLGDKRYEAYAVRSEGCCLSALGDAEAAIDRWLVAVEIDADRDDPGFVGYDWLLIGDAYNRLDRPHDAARALDQAIPRLSQAIDQDHEADARTMLARTLVNLGRPWEAVPHASRAADLAERLDDESRRASAWLAAGLADASRGEHGLAVERFSDALRALESLDLPSEAASTLRVLGDSLAALNHLPAAISMFQASRDAFKALGNDLATAEVLDLLAAAQADSGALKEAIQTARTAVDARRELRDGPGIVESLIRLAHYWSQNGDHLPSADTVAEALSTAPNGTTPAGRVRLLLLSASLERRAGRSDRARARLDEAQAIAEQQDVAALRRLVEDARAFQGQDQGRSRP
ncbi:MAG: hypothetical protein AB7I30_14670 [Isosphaeraceae bacterium]